VNNPLPVYLDYNATTPVDPRVTEAMLPYFTHHFGNAASRTHAYGWIADEAVEIAREKVATLMGAEKREIVFTSGATESVNMALKGLFEMYGRERSHLVTCKTEHRAVLDTCRWLEHHGATLTYLDVSPQGFIELKQLEEAITSQTLAVCIMLANNETGVIQPVEAIGEICQKKQVYFVSDATQAVGKIRVDVKATGISLLCFSSHKIYGPKGIGALYVSRQHLPAGLAPLIHGGGHERGLRSGTLNVPAIVGFGKACELAASEWFEEAGRLSRLRTHLEQTLIADGLATVNGSIKDRLPNTSNLCFRNLTASEFIRRFPMVAIATGSACTSASNEPSHVLMAMGLTRQQAQSSIRFSLGKFNSEEEISRVANLIRSRLITAS
jgi:cysteine desulfurase